LKRSASNVAGKLNSTRCSMIAKRAHAREFHSVASSHALTANVPCHYRPGVTAVASSKDRGSHVSSFAHERKAKVHFHTPLDGTCQSNDATLGHPGHGRDSCTPLAAGRDDCRAGRDPALRAELGRARSIRDDLLGSGYVIQRLPVVPGTTLPRFR
jgi:hypothetical protein